MTLFPWCFRGVVTAFLLISGQPVKPWSEIAVHGRTWKGRIARIREALDSAGGGQSPAADDVADALLKALTHSEKEVLLTRLQRSQKSDSADGMWVRIGKAFVQQILAASNNMSVLMVLLCVSLRNAGVTNHGEVRKLGIDIPKRTWSRTHSMQKVEPLKRRGNGRQGYRKLSRDVALKVLDDHSVESSQFLKGRKRPATEMLQEDSQEREVKIAKNLTDSKTQLYHCSECVADSVSKSTWMRYLKKDFSEYRCAKRRLDVCKKCLQWDQQVLSSAAFSFKTWRDKLEELVPSYFHRWDEEVVPALPPNAEKDMRVEYAEAFLNYVDEHGKSRPKSKAKGALKLAADLHRVEAEVAHELRSRWSKVRDQTSVGLLPLVQMHSLHFAVRDRSKEVNSEHRRHPADGTIYFQFDFKEHDTLPVGPEESGDFWYANARLGVTVLGICVWSAAWGVAVPMAPGEGVKQGVTYTSADGGEIPNLGERRWEVATREGHDGVFRLQVAKVMKPLLAVTQVTAMGNEVNFYEKWGEIVHKESGRRIRF